MGPVFYGLNYGTYILDGKSEIGAHVRNNFCYLTCTFGTPSTNVYILGCPVFRSFSQINEKSCFWVKNGDFQGAVEFEI